MIELTDRRRIVTAEMYFDKGMSYFSLYPDKLGNPIILCFIGILKLGEYILPKFKFL